MAPRSSRFSAISPGLVTLGVMAVGLLVSGCQKDAPPPISLSITPDRHTWFGIGPGTAHELGAALTDGKMQCQSCHPSDTTSFTQITCTGCHGHDETVTDRLHLTVPAYAFGDSAGCYSCHPKGDKQAFDHAGITNNCTMCHDVGAQFAALPKTGFTHPDTGGIDCAGCHNTNDWKSATGAPNSHDPAHDVMLVAQLPTFAGTSIVSLAAQTETLSMVMNHGSTDLPSAIVDRCDTCHPESATKGFFPGTLHASLTRAGVPQPTGCDSCHLDSMPTGMVGPTATSPARTPPSGEMRHEAVAWTATAPTGTRLVTTKCGVCHKTSTGGSGVSWSAGKTTAAVQYHASLAAAGMAQPTSCLDCHANTRPTGALDSRSAALSSGVTFDHAAVGGSGTADCGACHAASAAGSFGSWRMGRFHLMGSANPPSCLPCHAGERPTTTNGWTSTTYKNSPFDYVTNAAGSTHGDGQDCALCHAGPGTGAWGVNQNWVGGQFGHGADTHAAETCIACHSTQRPDLQPGTTAAAMASALGFDHSVNGTGECIGCHAATVSAGRYVNYNNPTTRALPGGDWRGAVSYPGSSLASSADQFISVTETKLLHEGTSTNVVGTTTVTDVLYNAMLHSSTALPPALAAGPTNAPDNSKCWHCHTNNNGTVTAFKNGQYHSALSSYRATPTGPVAPFPQPTSQCRDCHSAMVPDGVVKGATDPSLWPMDHAATLAMPITVNGATINGVSDLDCSVCHMNPGGSWAGAGFHYNIPSTAVASDCGACHYLTMTDPAADTASAAAFVMKHDSRQLGAQTCTTCHTGAKAVRAQLPATFALWKPGIFHATVTAQPTACLDCHVVSQPGANMPTQSTWSYPLKAGATGSNGGQWMNHGSSVVAGNDCAACHAADAQAAGSTWNRSTLLHRVAPAPRTCQECHGFINGGGGEAGMKNNVPAGLTSSTVATSASAASGVAGALSQITHSDINVSTRDCNFCHTQIGIATSASLQGKEWAQARFHTSFFTAESLVMNGTTGRCSNCHLNVNPKPGYSVFNHAGFSSAAGSQDCSGCHTFPGTGTASSPNWLGASTTAKKP